MSAACISGQSKNKMSGSEHGSSRWFRLIEKNEFVALAMSLSGQYNQPMALQKGESACSPASLRLNKPLNGPTYSNFAAQVRRITGQTFLSIPHVITPDLDIQKWGDRKYRVHLVLSGPTERHEVTR